MIKSCTIKQLEQLNALAIKYEYNRAVNMRYVKKQVKAALKRNRINLSNIKNAQVCLFPLMRTQHETGNLERCMIFAESDIAYIDISEKNFKKLQSV
jgi:hypothetical protein